MDSIFQVLAILLAAGLGFSAALNVNYSQQLASQDSRIDTLTNRTADLEEQKTSLQDEIEELEQENQRLQNYSLVNISQAIATGLSPEEYSDMATTLSNFTFNRDAGNEALRFGDSYYQQRAAFIEAASAYNLAESYYSSAQIQASRLQQFIQNEDKLDHLETVVALYANLQQLASRYEQLMYAYEDGDGATIQQLEGDIQRIRSSITEQRQQIGEMDGLLEGYLGPSTDGTAT